MDGWYIPLPLRLLAGVVLIVGLLGMWRARDRSAKAMWFAVMLLLFGIAAVGITMMFGAW